MRLALFQPDIPQNTGALLRLAACFGLAVDLIEPCGFLFDDRRLKRAGLDYAARVVLHRYVSWERFCAERDPASRLILLTTAGTVPLHEFVFNTADTLLVGRESAGVPDFVHSAAFARVAIPLHAKARSLNVAMAGAIALYEALRQTGGLPDRPLRGGERMKRRSFLVSALTLAGLPKIGLAQTAARAPRIGWIVGSSAAGSALFLDALRAGLAEHGHVEGRNLTIEARFGDDMPERVPALAQELLRIPVDLLVTQGPATRTLAREVSGVPIVYVFSADPIRAGIAQSLARPGGNATGISLMSVELNGKRVELLRELLPQLQRLTILANPNHAGAEFELEACENAARQLGIAIKQVLVRNPGELEESFSEIAAGKPEAITVIPDGLVIQKRARITDFAAAARIPVISGWKVFAESGAVCTYGPRLTESFRRAAYYVDRILKGEKPAEFPIERPSVFELVLNQKAANALGMTLPQSLLARADEVIE